MLPGTATRETTVAVTQEATNSSTSRSNCISLGHIPRGHHILLQRCLVNHVHCFLFFIISRNLKWPRCLSTNEWIWKCRHLHNTSSYKEKGTMKHLNFTKLLIHWHFSIVPLRHEKYVSPWFYFIDSFINIFWKIVLLYFLDFPGWLQVHRPLGSFSWQVRCRHLSPCEAFVKWLAWFFSCFCILSASWG